MIVRIQNLHRARIITAARCSQRYIIQPFSTTNYKRLNVSPIKSGPEVATEAQIVDQQSKFSHKIWTKPRSIESPASPIYPSTSYRFGEPLLEGELGKTEDGLLMWGAHGIPLQASAVTGEDKVTSYL